MVDLDEYRAQLEADIARHTFTPVEVIRDDNLFASGSPTLTSGMIDNAIRAILAGQPRPRIDQWLEARPTTQQADSYLDPQLDSLLRQPTEDGLFTLRDRPTIARRPSERPAHLRRKRYNLSNLIVPRADLRGAGINPLGHHWLVELIDSTRPHGPCWKNGCNNGYSFFAYARSAGRITDLCGANGEPYSALHYNKPSFADFRAAEWRAAQLFYRQLTPEQARSWWERRQFFTRASNGQWYLFTDDSANNVHEIDLRNNRLVASYCVTPSDGSLPTYDRYTAQLLLLRYNAKRFFEVANDTYYLDSDQHRSAWIGALLDPYDLRLHRPPLAKPVIHIARR